MGRVEASAPAGSDSDVAAAALSAAAVMFALDTAIGGGSGGVPAPRHGDAEHHSSGARGLAASPAMAWRDDDLWRASARLPRLVIRTEAVGADSPMMMGQPSPDHDAPVRL